MGLLDGKIAVITGAGSGMAKASTRVFVREGAKVLAADISGREKETADELGDAVVPFHCDVTNESDVQAMFAAALDAFGRVDAVLNVAGIGGDRAVPAPRRKRRVETRRPTRRGRGARGVPRIRPGELHHRCRHPHRRRDDGDPAVTETRADAAMSETSVYYDPFDIEINADP